MHPPPVPTPDVHVFSVLPCARMIVSGTHTSVEPAHAVSWSAIGLLPGA